MSKSMHTFTFEFANENKVYRKVNETKRNEMKPCTHIVWMWIFGSRCAVYEQK